MAPSLELLVVGALFALSLRGTHGQMSSGQSMGYDAALSEAMNNARGNLVECSLPPDTGNCRAEFIRVYFDAMTKECKTFYYGGCGGNPNRFTSFKACYEMCSPHEPTVTDIKVLSGKRYVVIPKPGDPPVAPNRYVPAPYVAPYVAQRQVFYQAGGPVLESIGNANLLPQTEDGYLITHFGGYHGDNGDDDSPKPLMANMKIKVIKYTNRASRGGCGCSPAPSCCGG